MTVVTLKIDDVDVSGRDDETILEIAQENALYIPTLCHLEGLTPVGSCRLCLVEVKGTNKLLPACVTRVREGMEVCTDSERLQQYRRTILEMLFVEGNHVCAVCVSNGNCDLQRLAQRIGMNYTMLDYRSPPKTVDASHYRFAIDHNRCVLCTRCVRVCDEIEGAHTWDVFGRGINAKVITDLDQPWGDSETCTSCGKCIEICPTGALFKKSRAAGQMEKRRDFLPYLTKMREVRK